MARRTTMSTTSRELTARFKGDQVGGPLGIDSSCPPPTIMETQQVTASVWPHDHRYAQGGPVDISIGWRSQPPVVRDWPDKKPLRISTEQPDPLSNLTIVRLGFGIGPLSEEEFRNVKGWRRKEKGITVYIKRRIYDSVPHPWPTGQWAGYVEFTERWAVFTIQARSLKVTKQEPERKIIIP